MKLGNTLISSKRLLFPDICKFVAIFIVTWSHFAQVISGETWTNFWGGYQLDIAFNMPLFMILSGWFIYPSRLRDINIKSYVIKKFKRLIVPAISWFLLLSLITLTRPSWFSMLTFYWYLTALFVGICIILIGCKLFKSTTVCCIVTIIFVLFLPSSSFSKINFLFPFLWAGILLRNVFNRLNSNVLWGGGIFSFLMSLVLYSFWSPKMTVYITPFDTLNFSAHSLLIYIYRFAIGFCVSFPIIFFIKTYENKVIKKLAPLGRYSLVIYTCSALFITLGSTLLAIYNIHCNILYLIDVVSFLLSLCIIYIIIFLVKIMEKSKILKFFFLGE